MIITHTDFDGLVSAFLLKEIFNEEKVYFTEPFLMEKIRVSNEDFICDLPFKPEPKLWFDHHKSNFSEELIKKYSDKIVFNPNAKSAARVIYDFLLKKGLINDALKKKLLSWVEAADKIDSASFTKEEIINPDVFGKISLSLRSDNYKIDNEYRRYLLELMHFKKPEDIINDKNVKKRIEEKRLKQLEFLKSIKKPFFKDDYLTIIKVEENNYSRPLLAFLIHNSDYILLIESKDNNFKISLSKNPFKKIRLDFDIGDFLLKYSGGGHLSAGGAIIESSKLNDFINELKENLKKKRTNDN